jgi:protein required for attachment to host cells
MESITEINNLNPSRQCSSCKVFRDTILFKDIKKMDYFKTCELCRMTKKKYRDKKRGAVEEEKEEKEASTKSKSSSSSSSSSSSDSKPASTKREHWLVDGWADMTAELLKDMTYEQIVEIHICATTRVSELNIFWICEKIIAYCSNDLVVKTFVSDKEIEVWITERGGGFTVELGDTWFEVREQLHCC